MSRVWICALIIAAASPAAAQTRVRLDVEVESWLDPTPFEALNEFTALLRAAGIEVVEDLDVPVVHLFYEETAGPGLSPRLVPATYIRLHMDVEDSKGNNIYQSLRTIRPTLTAKNFPSAAELRVRAIDDLRQHESFRLLGHVVGAMLDMESSYGPLLADKMPDTMMVQRFFRKVLWTPLNDGLFVRAFRSIRFQETTLVATLADEYLRKNLAAIQAASSFPPIASPLLAILLLEDYGEASATETLSFLVSHPLFGGPALTALDSIKARAAR